MPRTDRDAILNVSYDPTRELYQRIDPAFEADYATARQEWMIAHGGRVVSVGPSSRDLRLSRPLD